MGPVAYLAAMPLGEVIVISAVLAMCVAATPPSGPSVGVGVGVGAAYNLAPAASAAFILDLPLNDVWSVRGGLDGANLPGTTLWRAGAAAGMVARASVGPLVLAGGPALVVGTGPILVTDTEPPFVVDVGVGAFASVDWWWNEAFAIRASTLLPVSLVQQVDRLGERPIFLPSPHVVVGLVATFGGDASSAD